MKYGRAYLLALCLLLFATASLAQERAWTAALSRYEFICRRCASWRDAIDRGERVPKDSLQVMTAELKEVRKNLMYVLGDMSKGQRRWFEAVRDWFATGQWPVTTGPLEGSPDSSYSLGITMDRTLGITKEDTLDFSLQPSLGMTKKKVSCGAVAGLTVGVWPDVSGGVMAGVRLDKWYIFIKGRSNFTSQKASYECNADGTTDYGYFWSSGAKAVVARHQVTLDVSYAFTNPVSLYLGAGYGLRSLYWQDSEGAWAKVRDRSFRSVALDAGLLVHPIPRGPAKGLTFLAGISYIPRTYLDVEAGLAWRF